MLNIYKTDASGKNCETAEIEPGCWIRLTVPNKYEVDKVIASTGIDRSDIILGLDSEETAHIAVEDNYTIIVVDMAIRKKGAVQEFSTVPLEIIVCENFIVTVCNVAVELIEDFAENKIKNFSTKKRTRFILQILYKNASYYLQYLRCIDRVGNRIEKQLIKNLRNEDLLYLLTLEKSLVYFSTSLCANDIVLEKMLRMDTIKQYPEDEDLLEDVIVENKQAIEMANVYSSILSETRDAFASVISNNLNTVMQRLTSITIVLALPTMIFSLFGMNVPVPFMKNPAALAYILIISAIFVILGILVMVKKKMF
ncbi:magnesium transporter CorA family protein [Candidatus Epulonipiscium viviparus]|uniref:magnesium transporter CorA family protein n=1 Tax=Candidatus Epulonipiscium viviparus TaxID=420336 RepID=UPI00016C0F02|nr:magnesium transporter CorA family protein [Candidatus Epulopiscium viviparus]